MDSLITTHNGVEIEFFELQAELLDTVDSYDCTYLALGQGTDGKKYIASAAYSCGEFYELTDIEEA